MYNELKFIINNGCVFVYELEYIYISYEVARSKNNV